MKFLTMQDLDVEDSLALYWDGTFDPRMEIERALEPFFQALEEYAGEWMPDYVESKRRRKYTRAAVWKRLEESRTRYSSGCGLYHSAYLFMSADVSFGI
jgi:hypothetical protein